MDIQRPTTIHRPVIDKRCPSTNLKTTKVAGRPVVGYRTVVVDERPRNAFNIDDVICQHVVKPRGMADSIKLITGGNEKVIVLIIIGSVRTAIVQVIIC